MAWLGAPFVRMDRLLGRHAVLVEFWDFARVHSLRTLPYLRAWHQRYAGAGLQVIGVHSPRLSFGRDPDAVARAAERLSAVPRGARPGPGGLAALREQGLAGPLPVRPAAACCQIHYGEGEYLETELAIKECLREIDAGVELPEPLEPLRPEDARGR